MEGWRVEGWRGGGGVAQKGCSVVGVAAMFTLLPHHR